jgi:hypothetical protein
MSELASMDVTMTLSFQTSSTEINGMQLSEKETTEVTLTLPRATAVAATFSKEGIGKKLVKIFKKEMQTGDKAFDDAIYISTDTPEPTKALLSSDVVRELITLHVGTAGPIEIQGSTVKIVLAGRQEVEDPAAITLARALLALPG